MTAYIFVTGGVVSGLGKGVTAASIGRLLKSRGVRVCIQKLDPYLNVDPGTMSPYQHGEVFVTDDGAETDLDLGHYERFVDENLEPGQQRDNGTDLQPGAGQGTPGRLPGRHDPGYSPRDERDQAPHSGSWAAQQSGRRDRRGGWHGRRHRGSAFSGGHPPNAFRRRAKPHPVRPRDAAPLDLGQRRTEDQAHPAQRT